MATKFDSYKFMQEVFVYLGQEMKESADIMYITGTRNNLITKAEALGSDDRIIPNPFPLTGKYASPLEVLQLDSSGSTLAAIEQYFKDYVESRQLSNFDPSTLTAEAKRLAKLLLTSITEIATVIIMIGMTRIRLIERTPKKEHSALIHELHRNYLDVITSPDHTAQAITVCISYNTIDWKIDIDDDEEEGELTMHFIDDAN